MAHVRLLRVKGKVKAARPFMVPLKALALRIVGQGASITRRAGDAPRSSRSAPLRRIPKADPSTKQVTEPALGAR